MADTTQTPKASLLGLPRELRLQIFEMVLKFDVNHGIEDSIDTYLLRSITPRLDLPVQSLAMSCKSMADEVRAVVRSLPSSERFAIATTFVSECSYGAPYIRRAPCRIVDLRALKIEVIHEGAAPGTLNSMSHLARNNLGKFMLRKLEGALGPRSLLGKARALESVEVHVSFPPLEKCGGQSQDKYNNVMRRIRTEIVESLAPDALSSTTAAVLSIKFSIDK